MVYPGQPIAMLPQASPWMPPRVPYGPHSVNAPRIMTPGVGVNPMAAVNVPTMLPAAQPLPNQQNDAAPAGQMTPEMMMAALHAFQQNPQLKGQMAQMAELAKAGNLNPLLAGTVSPIPENQRPTLPKLILTGVTSGFLGFKGGTLLDQFMQGPRIIEFLRWVESTPGIRWINQKLEKLLQADQPTASRLNPTRVFKRFDGTLAPEVVLKQHIDAAIGPTGRYREALKKLKLPTSIYQHLTQAKNLTQIRQALEVNPILFLPKEAQAMAAPLMEGGYVWQWLGQPVGRILNQILPSTVLNYGRSVLPASWTKAPALTLGQLEKLAHPAKQALAAGHKPVWELVQQEIQTLIPGLKVSPNTTLGQLQRLIQKAHPMTRLGQTPRGQQLIQLLDGFLSRTRYFEKHHFTLAQGEHLLNQTLSRNGIGPVGRFIGKLGYYLQQVFSGANMKRIGTRLIPTSSKFGYVLAGFFLFGQAIAGLFTGNPDTRWSRFFHNLFSGIVGWYAWVFSSALFEQSGILKASPRIAKLMDKKLLQIFEAVPFLLGKLTGGTRLMAIKNLPLFRLLPWTWGGFITEFLVPSLAMSFFSGLAEKMSHAIFGNPETIEQKALFEADKKRPLTSQRKIMERYAQGEFPNIPGITPTPVALKDTTPLTIPTHTAHTAQLHIPQRRNPHGKPHQSPKASQDSLKRLHEELWSYAHIH